MRRLRAALVNAVVVTLLATALLGCAERHPDVVAEVEAAATVIVGEAAVHTDHFEGDPGGWQVMVLTTQTTVVSDAILAVFDGAPLTSEPDGSRSTVAGVVLLNRELTDTGEVVGLSVWLPASAIDENGRLTY